MQDINENWVVAAAALLGWPVPAPPRTRQFRDAFGVHVAVTRNGKTSNRVKWNKNLASLGADDPLDWARACARDVARDDAAAQRTDKSLAQQTEAVVTLTYFIGAGWHGVHAVDATTAVDYDNEGLVVQDGAGTRYIVVPESFPRGTPLSSVLDENLPQQAGARAWRFATVRVRHELVALTETLFGIDSLYTPTATGLLDELARGASPAAVFPKLHEADVPGPTQWARRSHVVRFYASHLRDVPLVNYRAFMAAMPVAETMATVDLIAYVRTAAVLTNKGVVVPSAREAVEMLRAREPLMTDAAVHAHALAALCESGTEMTGQRLLRLVSGWSRGVAEMTFANALVLLPARVRALACMRNAFVRRRESINADLVSQALVLFAQRLDLLVKIEYGMVRKFDVAALSAIYETLALVNDPDAGLTVLDLLQRRADIAFPGLYTAADGIMYYDDALRVTRASAIFFAMAFKTRFPESRESPYGA
jgi:hypothetical protein